MRGADVTQAALFSYRTLEARIPRDRPLRKFRTVVDSLLGALQEEFEANARSGGPSIAPERLSRASLIQTLYGIRSERQLVRPHRVQPAVPLEVEWPTGSGRMMSLFEVAEEISDRLAHIFLRDERGRRAVYDGTEKFQTDPDKEKGGVR
jgi:hypothetical protein